MSGHSLRFPRPVVNGLLALSLATLVAAQTKAQDVGVDPDVALARKSALDWLALVDGPKIESTWDEAATSFQKAQTKGEWLKGLGGARPSLGRLVSRRYLNYEIRTTLPDLPRAKYITVRFSTVFEKHKDGAESVTLIRDGARGFRVMAYYLQ